MSGDALVVLGGPAMLIGLGGGAASSMTSGSSEQALDFASVQRGNAEMERRCQEVINACMAQGEHNPIRSIHDVGAGGLSNALPELVEACGRGAHIDLRAIPSADPTLSPMALWCNEAQERYVIGISQKYLPQFAALCARERCPVAVLGEVSEQAQLSVTDELSPVDPVALPMATLFGRPPNLVKEMDTPKRTGPVNTRLDASLQEAINRVLRFPAVADKSFLITIGDRSVTGLVCRDQMVGPWQVPVADNAVTATDYEGFSGEAMALGERAPLAITDAAAAACMAVGESLTNLAGTLVRSLQSVVLSANWMAACGTSDQDWALREAVTAVGKELCPALGLAIPVGKDSLSMRVHWSHNGEKHSSQAPISLVTSAFAPVIDIRKTLTPLLRVDGPPSTLVLIDLAAGKQRLGHSALAQVFSASLGAVPDVDDPARLRAFFECMQRLNKAGLITAYHDRADGGLFVTLCEMVFAGHCGLDIGLPQLDTEQLLPFLFNEELGAVIQVRNQNKNVVLQELGDALGPGALLEVGRPIQGEMITVRVADGTHQFSRSALHQCWSETSYHVQALRDNPDCAAQAFAWAHRANRRGLRAELPFMPSEIPAPSSVLSPRFYSAVGALPRVGILREQGINGQVEMAAAFHRAGFEAIDVHMSDIVAGRMTLSDLNGLVACGGFSYGDVLGAGGGWAHTIHFNESVREAFAAFFTNPCTFTLGVCNGCQMLAQLRDVIPGAENWPRFIRNRSEQFESRLVMSKVGDSPSLFFTGMAGSCLPVVVAHGEGQVEFAHEQALTSAVHRRLVCLSYIDDNDIPTEDYPDNPNGSPLGITGLTTEDGRCTIMMPHPERLFRTVQHSWHPPSWEEDGPWLRMFHNARAWLG